MVSTKGKALRSAFTRRLGPCCLLAMLAGTEGRARAQDDSSSADTAAARSLAVDGMKLADAGKCPEAIDKLARAEKLHHAPIVLGRLGECQVAVGKIVDGTENLRKVVREPLPSNPTAALLKARERAQAKLDAAKPKIGMLTISIKGSNNATVTVDGQAVPSVLLDGERPTDPGEHVVEATAPGFLKASSRVTLGAGDKQGVTIKLEPDPNAALPAPAPATQESEPNAGRASQPRDIDSSSRAEASTSGLLNTPDRTGAYVAWGVGGAAFVVGSVFGVLTLAGKQDLDKQCLQSVCRPQSQDKLDTTKTYGNISTAAFAVAGAGVVLGTFLYISAAPSSKSSALTGPAIPNESRFRARAFVGIGQAGIAAEF
jgi:hypothetical protein